MDIKKKLENIWFYYKVPIIIGVIVLLLIGSTIKSKMEEVKYDHSVAIISEFNYPAQDKIEKIRNIFENKYGGSFNVVIYNVTLGETGQDETIISKLGLDLSNKISEYIFIEDMDTFKETTADIEFSEINLVSDVEWLSNLGLDNFYYCIRK